LLKARRFSGILTRQRIAEFTTNVAKRLTKRTLVTV